MATTRSLAMQAVRANPKDPYAWLNLGTVMATEGEKDKARDCYQRALNLSPSLKEAREGLVALDSASTVTSSPKGASTVTSSPKGASTVTSSPKGAKVESLSHKALDTHRAAKAAPSPKKDGRVRLLVGFVMAVIGISIIVIFIFIFFGRRGQLQLTNETIEATATRQPAVVATMPATWTPLPATATREPTATEPYKVGDATATPLGQTITTPTYLQGQQAYDRQEYEETLTLMGEVLFDTPSLAPPHWYRGMAFFHLGQYEEALAEMEQALALEPTYALAYADRGLLYITLEDEAQALADWEKALSLDPSLAKVYSYRGEFYLNQEEYQDALEQYEMAVKVDRTQATGWQGQSTVYLRKKNYKDCLRTADRALRLNSELLQGYYNRGVCHYWANKAYALAIADFDVYLAQVTDNAAAWFHRAYCYRKMAQQKRERLGRNEGEEEKRQAIADYNQAIEVDPSYHEAIINRGLIYYEFEEYKLALDDFNAALALGDIPLAFVGRGNVYRQLEKYEEALKDYEKAIALAPSYAATYGYMAKIYLGQGHDGLAIDWANKALSIDPTRNRGSVLLTRGRAHYGRGHYELALEDFSEVIKNHRILDAYYYRGLTYEAMGLPGRAVQDLSYFVKTIDEGELPEEVADAQQRLADLQP